MKILVVGATGRFAGMVVPELAKRGATVRGLIRDAGKREAVHAGGAADGGNGLGLEAVLGRAPRTLPGYFAELAAG